MESAYELDTRVIILKGNTKKVVFINETTQLHLTLSYENKENCIQEKSVIIVEGVNIYCCGCDSSINRQAEISFRLNPPSRCGNVNIYNFNIKLQRINANITNTREIILVHHRTNKPKSLKQLALRTISVNGFDIKNLDTLTDYTGFLIPWRDNFPELNYMCWHPLQSALFNCLAKSVCMSLFQNLGHERKPICQFNSFFLNKTRFGSKNTAVNHYKKDNTVHY
jgi:hypothetical protein